MRYLTLLLLALARAGCGGGDKAAGGGGSSRHAFRMRLPAMDGGEIDLSRYRGRVVVLHLFDTDSTAAPSDAEELSALWKRDRERVTVIGICLDPEGYPMAAAWRRALNVRYLIALGNDDMRNGRSPIGKLHVVPTTLILDRGGNVAARIERPLQPGELAERISGLLD
jgi:peroxiredoxin